MTAEIVEFPAPRPRTAGAGPAADPIATAASLARLHTALEALDAANNRQSQAVTGWRQALSDLQTSLQRLDRRLGQYRGQLDNLQRNLGALHDNARRMEHWAAARIERRS